MRVTAAAGEIAVPAGKALSMSRWQVGERFSSGAGTCVCPSFWGSCVVVVSRDACLARDVIPR
jgi:hypothetical protein